MTKADLVKEVHAAHSALSRSQAGALVDGILGILRARLAAGTRIHVTNFGSLEVTRRRKRRGRDPVTGRIVEIRPRRTLVFRPARRLEETLNAARPAPGPA